MDPSQIYSQNDSITNKNVLDNCLRIEVPYQLYQHIKSNGKLENLCRTCLSPIKEYSVSLLEILEDGSELCLGDMLKTITSFQEFSDPHLPVHICTKCQDELLQCYNFKIKCENSECTLQSLLKGECIPNDESIAQVSKLSKCDGDNLQYDEDLKRKEIKEVLKEDFDVQYLEDFDDDVESDSEALHIVLDRVKEKVNKKGKKVSGSREHGVITKRKKPKRQHITKNNQLTLNNLSKKSQTAKSIKLISVDEQNSENVYPCKECKEVFSSEHDQQVHLAVHSMVGSMWKCKKCPKEFQKKSQLRRHVQRHMEMKRYKCSACEKSFAEFYSLRRHSRVHTGEIVEKKHVCSICGKRYEGSHQLSAHMCGHDGARPFVCAACGKAFATARLLNSHRIVHSDDKPYACQYCDKRFRHDSTRNTHHRTHTGEKPYICSTCGKSFIQSSNLRLHMRTHTGERPYSCDKCDKKFTSGSSLKMHIRTHTGERPYSCKICNKRFARKDLSVHMRNHSGEKPFACNVCPKKFVNVTRLREHCRLHTGENPYECATCTQSFPTKSYLIKHFKKHQSEKKQEKQKKTPAATKRFLVVQSLLNIDYPYATILTEKESETVIKTDINQTVEVNPIDEITEEHIPLEVTEELVVHEEGELVFMDNSQNQSSNLYVSSETVNQCEEFDNNVNLVSKVKNTAVDIILNV